MADSDREVRGYVKLSGRDLDGIRDISRGFFGDEDYRVRQGAYMAYSLASRKGSKCIPALRDALEDESPLVRGNVPLAIYEVLRGEVRLGTETDESYMFLQELAEHSDEVVRERAEKQIGLVGELV
jgi:HEAT repeat protein